MFPVGTCCPWPPGAGHAPTSDAVSSPLTSPPERAYKSVPGLPSSGHLPVLVRPPLVFPESIPPTPAAAAMAVAVESVEEVLPPNLDSTADPPSLFDGTTRMYISYTCPYAQRTWIARNYRGLQEKIKLVPIDLQNRPAWYKEKVYPGNKVPSLEHNNEVKGESLDLLKYIDTHFEGPALLPDDPAKREFAEELLSYSDTFNLVSFKACASSGDVEKELGPAYDKIEDALSKFDDGPFFLGQFSLVDVAYAPFIERFQPFFAEVKNYDITKGRPKLALWIEELNKIEAYKQTQRDPREFVAAFKKRLGIA